MEERLGTLKLDTKILHARVDRELVHREFVLGVKHMGRGAVVPVKRLQVGAVVEGRAQGGINHRVPRAVALTLLEFIPHAEMQLVTAARLEGQPEVIAIAVV